MEAFWAALEAAVPRWRERRSYPLVYAAFAPDLPEAAHLALGRELAPEGPLEDALDEMLSPETARTAVELLLRTTLAYGTPWLEAQAAGRVAEAFVGCFGPEAGFRTNADLWVMTGSGRTWTPLTRATFDTGVVGVDAELAAMLWFVDED